MIFSKSSEEKAVKSAGSYDIMFFRTMMLKGSVALTQS